MPLHKYHTLSKAKKILWVYGQIKIYRPSSILGVKIQDQSKFCIFNCLTEREISWSKAILVAGFAEKRGIFFINQKITLKIEYVSLYEFLYLFYNSKNKDEIRELCDKKIIEAQIITK